MTNTNVDAQERYSVFPFYLCLDVSASMAGAPIDAVNRQLPVLRSKLGEDPAVAEVIRFGVVTFSDVAHSVLPLCDLSLVEAVPEVAAQGRTSYAAAFDHLRQAIEDDYQHGRERGDRWYRPGGDIHLRRAADRRLGAVERPHSTASSTLRGSADRTSWLSASGTPIPRCSPR